MGYQFGKENMKIIFYAIFIIFVAVVLIIGAKLYFNKKVDVWELENSLVTSRVLFSEDCLAKEENFGEINLDNLYEEYISKCTGLGNASKQGLRLRLYDYGGELVREVELNKALTSQCLIGFMKSIRDKYGCSYSKHYVFYKGEKGILEILVVNEINK